MANRAIKNGKLDVLAELVGGGPQDGLLTDCTMCQIRFLVRQPVICDLGKNADPSKAELPGTHIYEKSSLEKYTYKAKA